MQGGKRSISKKRNCLGYGVRRGLYARGKTIDFQKNKNLGYVGAEKLSFEGFLGGHKVAKSK